jgi:deoxycytidine triphosphate deaminase
MPRLITENELKTAVELNTFIKNGNVNNAEGVKYDFCLGSELLKAVFGRPIDMLKLPENNRTSLNIEPGEVVFVLTKEELDLPNNIHAVLSPKRKLSHDGIMVLGGF